LLQLGVRNCAELESLDWKAAFLSHRRDQLVASTTPGTLWNLPPPGNSSMASANVAEEALPFTVMGTVAPPAGFQLFTNFMKLVMYRVVESGVTVHGEAPEHRTESSTCALEGVR